MLNARENMEAVINGGTPDRYVNNYEGMQIFMTPKEAHELFCTQGAPPAVDEWGITWVFPEGTPGQFPVHNEETIVIKDIEDWKSYVKEPSLDFSEAEWDVFRQQYRDADRSNAIVAAFYHPGLFEMTHHLSEITNALMACITNTDEMIELVKWLTEHELKAAEGICTNLKPDAIFHHDDWGSEENSFLRPELFDEIFLDAYKEIYGYYKSHGVKYVFHHSDSYAANLVPEMIEMGIDVWQGAMYSNDVPELVKKYGDKITIMGNIDNKFVDFEGCTPADCRAAFLKCTKEQGLGPADFIPCITQGGPGSTFPGIYKMLTDDVDAYNAEALGVSVDDIVACRQPLQIMFG